MVDETYTTPYQHHNPMEPHATLAWWEGDKLNVYDATQYITGDRATIALTLGIPVDNVHLQCPYTGGGFGSKGSTWSHVILTAMAARITQRPVKLALERPQMWGPVGGRPCTVQHIKLGAASDGKLTAIQHDVIVHTSVMEDFLEPSAYQTRMLYASEACQTSHKLVDMNLGVATFQRAPGEATGTAAFETAMDELAVKLNIDPVQLRLINYAEKDPGSDKPWSISICASATLRPPSALAGRRAILKREPRAKAASSSARAWQLQPILPTVPRPRPLCESFLPGARLLDAVLRILARVHTQSWRRPLPMSSESTQHWSRRSLAIPRYPRLRFQEGRNRPQVSDLRSKTRLRQVILKLAQLAIDDPQSPLHGAAAADILASDGKLYLKSAPTKSESFFGNSLSQWRQDCRSNGLCGAVRRADRNELPLFRSRVCRGCRGC